MKHTDTSPRFLAVDLERQLLPGTFEHALCWLIDHEIDLTGFDVRYRNDLTGASAYPSALLLKVILFAYSRGIVSSREIERACRDQITFIALSGDSAPHFRVNRGLGSSGYFRCGNGDGLCYSRHDDLARRKYED
nr:IS4 family transposase [uncultured bacterium]